jgi:hypothetical protein
MANKKQLEKKPAPAKKVAPKSLSDERIVELGNQIVAQMEKRAREKNGLKDN